MLLYPFMGIEIESELEILELVQRRRLVDDSA
jgi:hypothetical protein